MKLHFILFSAELSRPVYSIPNASYHYKFEETKLPREGIHINTAKGTVCLSYWNRVKEEIKNK